MLVNERGLMAGKTETVLLEGVLLLHIRNGDLGVRVAFGVTTTRDVQPLLGTSFIGRLERRSSSGKVDSSETFKARRRTHAIQGSPDSQPYSFHGIYSVIRSFVPIVARIVAERNKELLKG